ncbi:hypothetical protein VTK26DRAFT_2932 [Humicola hyalothermophila]
MSGLTTAPPTTHSHQPTTSSSSSGLSSGTGLRKERGAIAAQACDTCRSRKQRCDEQRPKCGTCQKFGLECNYREPQPTKKDKTLVEILDHVRSLEGKVDTLSRQLVVPPSAATYAPQSLSSHPSPMPTAAAVLGPPVQGPSFQIPDCSSVSSAPEDHYRYVSSVHGMLKWPAIQQLFASIQPNVSGIDLTSLEREAPLRMLTGRHATAQRLPADTPVTVGRGSGMDIRDPMTSQAPTTGSGLDWVTMQRLSKAYFDVVNLSYPILDRRSFMSETLPALFNNGFDQSMASTIAFLVFALGEVALASTDGPPVHVYNGRTSGVKGGTKKRPPGLELFNEARRRMGFNLTECSLENVQVYALASIYYGCAFHHMDYWRMTTSASVACQELIASNPGVLSSFKADLLRRVFWHCSIMETGLNLELGFPLTGLEKLESIVGLPDFSGPFTEEDYISNQESHFQEHFASQIVLRRLLVDFHGSLSQGTASSISPARTPFSSETNGSSVNQATIQQLAVQLEQWRGVLPAHLRWQEDSPGAFPDPHRPVYNSAVYTRGPPKGLTPPFMFTTDLDGAPPRYPYSLDSQVALLRSRYYYTKYLIHRPFVYKALHYPDAMGHEDAVGAAECLKASLKWPVAMSPTCKNKRLVPCSFFFTQNFFGILLLLHLSTTVPILRQIRSTLCGERFELDARETVGLYLDWLRDLRPIDTGMNWHWDVVRVLYGLED